MLLRVLYVVPATPLVARMKARNCRIQASIHDLKYVQIESGVDSRGLSVKNSARFGS